MRFRLTARSDFGYRELL